MMPLDKERPSLGISVDLTKSFDTVEHILLLLTTLEKLGVIRNAHNLFKSCLIGRKQKVKVYQ